MKNSGVTLLEFLFVLAILAILSLVGVRAYSGLTEHNELTALTDTLKNAVHYGRIQAITLGQTTYLMPIDARSDWQHGIQLMRQTHANGAYELLYQWPWHTRFWNIHWSGVHGTALIKLSPNPDKAMSNGTYTITQVYSGRQIKLVLNKLGRLHRVPSPHSEK